MARRVVGFGLVRCLSIEPVGDDVPNDWAWRLAYVGLTGYLDLFESEKKKPGAQFIKFSSVESSDDRWFLRSYFGTHEIKENEFVFVTENTKYTFRLYLRES